MGREREGGGRQREREREGRTLTSILDIICHALHIFLSDLIDADCLGVRERSQDVREKPHPLVPVPTGKTENLVHLLGTLCTDSVHRGQKFTN